MNEFESRPSVVNRSEGANDNLDLQKEIQTKEKFEGIVSEIVQAGFPKFVLEDMSMRVLSGQPKPDVEENSLEAHLYFHLSELLLELGNKDVRQSKVDATVSLINVLKKKFINSKDNVIEFPGTVDSTKESDQRRGTL